MKVSHVPSHMCGSGPFYQLLYFHLSFNKSRSIFLLQHNSIPISFHTSIPYISQKLQGIMLYTFNPALRRQRQADLYEFKASLVYMMTSRPPRATKWDLVFKKKSHFNLFSSSFCVFNHHMMSLILRYLSLVPAKHSYGPVT